MSSGEESYGAFAYAYDQALGSSYFRVVEPLLAHLVDRNADDVRTHLDLACGTGFAVEWFAARGYRSFGLDGSIEMLHVGKERIRSPIASDLRRLSLRRPFSRVTSLYDSLNHLLTEEDLAAAFREVRRVLGDAGLFFFDMNHTNAYEQVWSITEPYVSETAESRLEIATSYDRRSGIATGLVSGFAMTQGERIEIRETHLQRAYGEKTIVKLLRQSGLQPVELIHFDPFQQGSGRGKPKIKIFFVARPK